MGESSPPPNLLRGTSPDVTLLDSLKTRVGRLAGEREVLILEHDHTIQSLKKTQEARDRAQSEVATLKERIDQLKTEAEYLSPNPPLPPQPPQPPQEDPSDRNNSYVKRLEARIRELKSENGHLRAECNRARDANEPPVKREIKSSPPSSEPSEPPRRAGIKRTHKDTSEPQVKREIKSSPPSPESPEPPRRRVKRAHEDTNKPQVKREIKSSPPSSEPSEPPRKAGIKRAHKDTNEPQVKRKIKSSPPSSEPSSPEPPRRRIKRVRKSTNKTPYRKYRYITRSRKALEVKTLAQLNTRSSELRERLTSAKKQRKLSSNSIESVTPSKPLPIFTKPSPPIPDQTSSSETTIHDDSNPNPNPNPNHAAIPLRKSRRLGKQDEEQKQHSRPRFSRRNANLPPMSEGSDIYEEYMPPPNPNQREMKRRDPESDTDSPDSIDDN